MAFDVYFVNSTKPENSTSAFSITGKTPIQCTLKAGTSISHPVIVLQDGFTYREDNIKMNTAYIPTFGRYYFVTDWSYDGQLLVCSLSVDVLASFWTELKERSYYVTRNANTWKKDVVDTKYPAIASKRSYSVKQVANPFQPSTGFIGSYVVGLVNRYGGMDGCTQYYAMGDTEFKDFMSKIFTITNYGTFGTFGDNNDTLTDDLAEVLVNPLQYIASIVWLPYTTTEIYNAGFTSTTMNVTCGYTSVTLTNNVYKFDDTTVAKHFTNVISLDIVAHPDANTRGNWLKLSPYSEYRLSFYPFGCFSIEPEYLNGNTKLYLLYTVDARTGKAILNVGTSVSGTDSASWIMPEAFLTVEAQMGVEIPTSTVETQMKGVGFLASAGIIFSSMGLFDGFQGWIKDAYSEVKGAVADFGNYLLGNVTHNYDEYGNYLGLSSAGAHSGGPTHHSSTTHQGSISQDIGQFLDNSGIGSALLQSIASPNISGQQGTMSFYSKQKVVLQAWFKELADPDDTHFGKPLCTVKQLKTISGFTVCSGAIADIARATYAEKRKIQNFLNTGFYIE